MTRAEFDVWIEQHYQELLKVARRRTNSTEDAQDALHNAMFRLMDRLGSIPLAAAWTHAVNAIRSTAGAVRTSGQRVQALKRASKNLVRAGDSLGRKRPAPRAE